MVEIWLASAPGGIGVGTLEGSGPDWRMCWGWHLIRESEDHIAITVYVFCGTTKSLLISFSGKIFSECCDVGFVQDFSDFENASDEKGRVMFICEKPKKYETLEKML